MISKSCCKFSSACVQLYTMETEINLWLWAVMGSNQSLRRWHRGQLHSSEWYKNIDVHWLFRLRCTRAGILSISVNTEQNEVLQYFTMTLPSYWWTTFKLVFFYGYLKSSLGRTYLTFSHRQHPASDISDNSINVDGQ